MQVVYTGEEMPQSFSKSIFLAGPTPRVEEVPSWRPDAIQLLEDMGYDGVVFVPEDREGGVHLDYDDQITWEEKHLNVADCIVFWVPRDISPDSTGFPRMPAFTTNIEWGVWEDSGKVVLGAPEDAEKMGYLKHYAEEFRVPFSETLTETLKSAMDMVGEGAERSGGERYVPLFIWKLDSFQNWYTVQKEAGNVLEDARLLFSFRPNYKDWVYLWILQVNIYVSEEDRFKTTDFVMARPDISSIVMYKREPEWEDTQVVIIKEYRPTASTPDGFVHELPSGSSSKHKSNEEIAAEEVHEETGYYLSHEHLKRHEARQLAPTLMILAYLVNYYKENMAEYETEDEMFFPAISCSVSHPKFRILQRLAEDWFVTDVTFQNKTRYEEMRQTPSSQLTEFPEARYFHINEEFAKLLLSKDKKIRYPIEAYDGKRLPFGYEKYFVIL